MGDEFLDHDLDTPTEADLDRAYGSQYLAVTDIGDRKVRTKIAKVRKAELEGNNGSKRLKFILHFDTLDKPMVLNATNKNAIVEAVGKNPAKWIDVTVGVYVDPNVVYAGKHVKGLRLRVLNQPIVVAPVKPPEEPPPPSDDPFGDSVPDFT